MPAAMDELDEIARFEIQEGWEVLDADDERIGKVSEVHVGSFTIETQTGGRREISFTDIESADDGRVNLSMSGEELTSDLGR
jgi:hypothetical protein